MLPRCLKYLQNGCRFLNKKIENVQNFHLHNRPSEVLVPLPQGGNEKKNGIKCAFLLEQTVETTVYCGGHPLKIGGHT